MSKIITLRLDSKAYRLFSRCAEADNRPLSNFIETAAKRYVEESEFVDSCEMAEINADVHLKQSIQQGHKDTRSKKGRRVG